MYFETDSRHAVSHQSMAPQNAADDEDVGSLANGSNGFRGHSGHLEVCRVRRRRVDVANPPQTTRRLELL